VKETTLNGGSTVKFFGREGSQAVLARPSGKGTLKRGVIIFFSIQI
jgi:hypothetical protein